MIRRLFFDGLKVFLPFLVAVWLLSWIFRWIDSMLAPIVGWITGWEHPVLGSGVLLGILLVFLLGLCVRIPFVRDLIKKLQRNFRRLPGVKTVYDMTENVYSFFSSKDMGQGRVVTVDTELGELMGIVTRDKFDEMPEGFGGPAKAAVYFPMSYQIGGFTFLINQDSLKSVDLSVEEGLTLTMSAGLSKSGKESDSEEDSA